MTIDDKIKDKNLQYNIEREGTRMSALVSDKIHKYEYISLD